MWHGWSVRDLTMRPDGPLRPYDDAAHG